MTYKVANYYAGLGGNRQKWKDCQVTAVEMDPAIAEVYQDQFPDDIVIVGDAHQHLLENHQEFDFIWSSPPCQRNSRMMKATRHKLNRYPDLRLYEEAIFLEHFFKGKYAIENVVPYYEPLIPGKRVGRHLFWTNFEFEAEDVPRPPNFINKANLEGKRELMDWLGIHYEKNIYYGNNHCPAQILRNCVHPDLGLQIFEQAFTEQPFRLQG